MKIESKQLTQALIAGLLSLGFAGAASAVSYNATTADNSVENTAPNNTTSITVALVGDGATTTVQTRVDYNTTIFNVTAAAATGSPAGVTCLANDGTGRVAIIVPPSVPAAALASAPLCTLSVTAAVGAAPGTYDFSFDGASTIPAASPAPTALPITVTTNAPPTIANGAFATNNPTGTEGVVTSIGNITFAVTTAAQGSGTGSVVCADAAGGPAFTFNPSTATTVNSGTAGPVSVGVSCPLRDFGTGALAGDATCTIVDSAGTRNQTINISCPEGADAVGPILNPPAQTTITLAPVLVGQQSTAGIQFTATGGQTGQSTLLNCTATAPAVIVSGNNQNVATGSQPAAVVVGITLTGAAQTGSVTCGGTTFAINAPAGSTLEPAAVVPASSLWSQLSLIALFAALGGLFVALRRNA